MLACNGSLRNLSLSGNPLGCRGVCALSSALCANTTLASLHLSAVVLSDQACMSLSRALACNKVLRSLALSSQNPETDDKCVQLGVLALGHALAHNADKQRKQRGTA